MESHHASFSVCRHQLHDALAHRSLSGRISVLFLPRGEDRLSNFQLHRTPDRNLSKSGADCRKFRHHEIIASGAPTCLAGIGSPESNRTPMRSACWTTWKFVTTCPTPSHTKPESAPILLCACTERASGGGFRENVDHGRRRGLEQLETRSKSVRSARGTTVPGSSAVSKIPRTKRSTTQTVAISKAQMINSRFSRSLMRLFGLGSGLLVQPPSKTSRRGSP